LARRGHDPGRHVLVEQEVTLAVRACARSRRGHVALISPDRFGGENAPRGKLSRGELAGSGFSASELGGWATR
jgi:hypothetical protein